MGLEGLQVAVVPPTWRSASTEDLRFEAAVDDEATVAKLPMPLADLTAPSLNNKSLTSPSNGNAKSIGVDSAGKAKSKARFTSDRVARARQANAARMSEAAAHGSPGIAIEPTI